MEKPTRNTKIHLKTCAEKEADSRKDQTRAHDEWRTMHSMHSNTWMYEYTPGARTGYWRSAAESWTRWRTGGSRQDPRYTRAPFGEEAVGGPIMHNSIEHKNPYATPSSPTVLTQFTKTTENSRHDHIMSCFTEFLGREQLLHVSWVLHRKHLFSMNKALVPHNTLHVRSGLSLFLSLFLLAFAMAFTLGLCTGPLCFTPCIHGWPSPCHRMPLRRTLPSVAHGSLSVPLSLLSVPLPLPLVAELSVSTPTLKDSANFSKKLASLPPSPSFFGSGSSLWASARVCLELVASVLQLDFTSRAALVLGHLVYHAAGLLVVVEVSSPGKPVLDRGFASHCNQCSLKHPVCRHTAQFHPANRTTPKRTPSCSTCCRPPLSSPHRVWPFTGG